MISRLRFKNWRSLQDVEIDNLTPLTVFIGSNSSGKTNILDALYFLRDSNRDGAFQAIQNRGGAEKVHTLTSQLQQPIEIQFDYEINGDLLTYKLGLEYDTPNFLIPNVAETLTKNSHILLESPYEGQVSVRPNLAAELHPIQEPPWGWDKTVLSSYGSIPNYEGIYETYKYITERWQMLDENFMPPLTLSSMSSGDLTLIDRCANNVLIMLDFMQKVEPEIYRRIQDDLRWLLTHVDNVDTQRDEHEMRLAIKEELLQGREAPTISAGTARLVAMLTAYHALNRSKVNTLPGLVVIEEPDTALNPWLLQAFVEQLRNYTSHEYPRQFIMTTHNPRFLNYFEPEEVRIVKRGEDGYTLVQPVPDYIREIWLDEYGLGEVWTTGALGGVPE